MRRLLFLFLLVPAKAFANYEAGKAVAVSGVQTMQRALKDSSAVSKTGIPVSERPLETSLYNKDKLQKHIVKRTAMRGLRPFSNPRKIDRTIHLISMPAFKKLKLMKPQTWLRKEIAKQSPKSAVGAEFLTRNLAHGKDGSK